MYCVESITMHVAHVIADMLLIRLPARSLLFSLSVSNVADDPSRNTRDDRIVGDVAGYHCASTYQSALPNADAGENGGIAAQRGAPFNSRWDDLPVALGLELPPPVTARG